jgi:ubiquinone/menaquinone biosynthesis C-methylase UbiE
MHRKDILRTQFNRQAEKFSSWFGTRNQQILQQLYDFVGFSETDELLDVACGSGEFAIFCANRIRRVHGIDISPKMVQLANQQLAVTPLPNLSFECHDVEDLPCESNSFSVVMSRSAFHHMEDYSRVFEEMVRCCRKGGLLCVEDLAAYDIQHVNDFFNDLDRSIDPSHNARVTEQAFRDLFVQNALEIITAVNLDFEIDVRLYASHALQSEDGARRFEQLLQYGLRDLEVSRFLYKKDEKVVFSNRGFRAIGRK